MFGSLFCVTGMRAALADLPMPCGGACGPNTNLGWVQSGTASLSVTGNTMNINQQSATAILNWQSFNVGQDNTVQFIQPNTDAVALNRVFDPSVNPSRILGSIKANGQVYLINPNGFIFGKNAHINVHSLVASTLNVSDDTFNNGIGSAINNPGVAQQAAFQGSTQVNIVDASGNEIKYRVNSNGDYALDNNGKLIPDNSGIPFPIQILIEKGADIKALNGGRIMALAQNIVNHGDITAADGQIILAAGNKVYLQSSAELRGFLVEVNVDAVSNDTLNKAVADQRKGDKPTLPAGNVANDGSINADRGNVSIAGLAINQAGTISATTAVASASGSIRLMARDQASVVKDPNHTNELLLATQRTGLVTFSENSQTSIKPDKETASDTARIADSFTPSKLEVMARDIEMLANSTITVPAGVVDLTAIDNPSAYASATSDKSSTPVAPESDAMVRMQANSHIDVSGVSDVLPMSRNAITEDLYGNELADSPLQRNGVLKGKTVTVDRRQLEITKDADGNIIDARTPIADFTAAVQNVQQTVQEKSSVGGTVSINTTGDVVLEDSSSIDVSGGTVTYEAGYINSTKLVSDGRVFDLNTADPNIAYDGLFGVKTYTNNKWGTQESYSLLAGGVGRGEYQTSYVEGQDAGKVNLVGYGLQLNGLLKGNTKPGLYQREQSSAPRDAALVIGDPTHQGAAGNYFTPDVVIGSKTQTDSILQSGARDDVGVSTDYLALQLDNFTRNGVNNIAIYSNGRISILSGNDVTLNNGGKLSLTAQDISIASSVKASSGELVFTVDNVHPTLRRTGDSGKFDIADNVSLDTSGSWVNDLSVPAGTPDLLAPVYINGGSITLANKLNGGDASELNIGDNVTIDTSAGAWVQTSGAIKAGKGGDIGIQANFSIASVNIGNNLSLKSEALEQGGTLSLAFPEAVIKNDADTSRQPGTWGAGQTTVMNNTDIATLTDQVIAAYNKASSAVDSYNNDPANLATGNSYAITPELIYSEMQQTNGLSVLSQRTLINQVLPSVIAQFSLPGQDTQQARQTIMAGLVQNSVKPVNLSSSALTEGGFSAINVTTNNGDLVVDAGTTLQLQADNRYLNDNYRQQVSGTAMETFSVYEPLLDYMRKPVDLSLRVDNQINSGQLPQLLIGEAANIETDPLANVSLYSNGSVNIEGSITAPAGDITVIVDHGGNVYDASRRLTVTGTGVLDVAGMTVMQPNALGLRLGEVLAGGTVQLRANGGYIDLQKGSIINANGASAALDISQMGAASTGAKNSGSTLYRRQQVSSNGGSVDLTASEGINIDGNLAAQGGDATAFSGDLNLGLTAVQQTRPTDVGVLATYSKNDRTIELNQDIASNSDATSANAADADVQLINTLKTAKTTPAYDGKALVSVNQLETAGFDKIHLMSDDRIEFNGNIDMKANRAIELDSRIIAVKDTGSSTDPALIQTNVAIAAPYLEIGPQLDPRGGQDIPQKVNIRSKLTLGDADTGMVDLIGNTGLQGFEQVNIHSQGDIRLRDLIGASSGLYTDGNLDLAAQQIYPTTLSDFTLSSASIDAFSNTAGDSAARVAGEITIDSTGGNLTPVMSAGGSITLAAENITQRGVLKAPLGTIDVVATPETIVDASTGASTEEGGNIVMDGVTSTAADVPLVPYGNIVSSENWFYSGSPNIYQSGKSAINAPEQSIRLQGQQVSVNNDATINMSGGGDVLGYEFLPGPGGSKDVLDPAVAQSNNTYVILPWLKDGYAPQDRVIDAGWNLNAGDSVNLLEGATLNERFNVNGKSYQQSINLAAGKYPLLPARYALVPGAIIVNKLDSYQDLQPGQNLNLLDGGRLVAGQLAAAGSNEHDSRTSGFVLYPRNYAFDRSEYNVSTLTDFLQTRAATDQVSLPRLPQDAGRLVINANTAIDLQGTVNATPGKAVAMDGPVAVAVGASGPSGQGGELDIVARELAIVQALGAPEDEDGDGINSVQLVADDLNKLGLQSIVIGAERKPTAEATTDVLAVAADKILVKSGVELSAPELILAAKGMTDSAGQKIGITVETGSTLKGTGVYNGVANDLAIGDTAASGDGALLRLSSSNQINLDRVNTTGSNTAGASGVLDVQSGATISADKSVMLDASVATRVDGELQIQGGSLALGAERINLGDVPADAQGLTLSSDVINGLGVAQLVLSSRSTVDVFGNVDFGIASDGSVLLDSLEIRSAGINGYASGDIGTTNDASLVAQNIRLTNINNSAAYSVATSASGADLPLGNGSLILTAREVDTGAATNAGTSGEVALGDGTFAIHGFDKVSLHADRSLVVEGRNLSKATDSNGNLTDVSALKVDGDLTLAASRLTATTGAHYAIDAAGHNVNLQPSSAATPIDLSAVDSLGAQLSISGASISDAAAILLPSGSVTLTATGTGGDVQLLDGALINVAGTSKLMGYTLLESGWGGDVLLQSSSGDVRIEQGAVVDVSGASPESNEAGSNAGSINIVATDMDAKTKGTVSIDGQLLARSQTGFSGGSFSVYARQLDDNLSSVGNAVSDVNQVLNNGNFTTARNLHLRTGDISVEAGDTNAMHAHAVTLTADGEAGIGGSITVAGDIDAAGNKGGTINLNAARDISVVNGATLRATASDDSEAGGEIALASRQGSIDLQSGAVLDVSGGNTAQGGKLHLRTQRVDSNGDGIADNVAITNLKSSIQGARRIDVEGYTVYSASGSIDSALQTQVINDATAFANQADSIKASLVAKGANADLLHLTSGIEIQSTGNLSLNTEWNLLPSRFWNGSGGDSADPAYHTEPAVLTIRSTGDINFNASLTDGFEAADKFVDSGDSWSYQITSGADLSSADAGAVSPLASLVDANGLGIGSINLASNVRVRTGTGDINMNAGRNVKFADKTASVYTAGLPAVPGQVYPPADNGTSPPCIGFFCKKPTVTIHVNEEWPTSGGNINVQAQNDIVGAVSDNLISNWLWREGNSTASGTNTVFNDSLWAVDFSKFDHNIGALGGGNVQVNAGRDVTELSVSIPTTGKQFSPGADRSDIQTWGGGDMMVTAGRDVNSGVFFLGKGQGVISSKGDMTAATSTNTNAEAPLDMILAVQDGRFKLDALGNVKLGAIVNPTVLPTTVPANKPETSTSAYFTYGVDSAAEITSLAGDVGLLTETHNIPTFYSYSNVGTSENIADAMRVIPPSLIANALNGAITVDETQLYIYPSATGDFRLVAAGDIATGNIFMSDADPLYMPTAFNPPQDGSFGNVKVGIVAKGLSSVLADTHALIPVHSTDSKPVYLISDKGSITASNGGLSRWVFPKQTRIVAGSSIHDVVLDIQNINADDVSLVQAGGNITLSHDKTGAQQARINVAGPGRLDVIAGGNLDLGTTQGITTTGNNSNPALSDSGASINVMVGMGTGPQQYGRFIQDYFYTAKLLNVSNPEDRMDSFMRVVTGSSTYARAEYALALASYKAMSASRQADVAQAIGFDNPRDMELLVGKVESFLQYQALVLDRMRTVTGNAALTMDDAIAQFAQLDSLEQRPVVLKAFFNELLMSGRNAAASGNKVEYDRGYTAAQTLFPSEQDYHGDLSMFLSRIYSLDGGDITILIPGGIANAGLAGSALVHKKPGDLGIVTQRAGDINAFSSGDFMVNQSRVMSLLGGNIVMWSSSGNLDAGRGSKAAVSAPAPTVTFDALGNVIVDFSGAIAGSGIRAIDTDPTVGAGNVDLFAPKGIINAGDAGIGGKNVTFGAQTVIGAENVDVSGVSVGVPAVNAASMTLGLSGVSNVSGGVGKSADNAMKNVEKTEANNTPIADAALSYLEVFVIGLGDDDDQDKKRKSTH